MNLTNALVLVGLTALPLSTTVLDGVDDAPALAKQLGSIDYKARKEAFRALEKLGPAARTALKNAQLSEDPEVRWNAALLLDRLEQAQAERGDHGDPLARRSAGDSRDDTAGGSTEGWLRETDDPVDDAAHRTEDDAKKGGTRRRVGRGWPFEFNDAFQQLRDSMRRLEEWQQQMEQPGSGGARFGFHGFDDDLFGDLNGLPGQQGALGLAPGSSFSRVTDNHGKRESVSVQVDQQGHVKATVEKDGKQQSYEADSIETFKKEHPELLAGFGGVTLKLPQLGRGDGLWMPRGRAQPGQAQKPDARLPPVTAPQTTASEGPKLGVQIEAVPAAVAEQLELDAGVGLRVVEVMKGSAAEQLGILKRDIITEVNGRTIRGIADVQAALKESDPSAADVTVIRRGEIKKL